MRIAIHFIASLLSALVLSFDANAQSIGIYEGSGTVPSNTVATITDNLLIGKTESGYPSVSKGLFLRLNYPNKSINMISQGSIMLGDPSKLSLAPTYLELDNESGTIRHYALNDQLFQVDSFFYSLRKGAFQLPNNINALPFFLEGDAGSIYYKDGRMFLWDGLEVDSFAMKSDISNTGLFISGPQNTGGFLKSGAGPNQVVSSYNKEEYNLVTGPTTLTENSKKHLYVNPPVGITQVNLPSLSVADGSVFIIKNTGTVSTAKVRLNCASSNLFAHSNLSTLIVLPGKTVVIHGTAAGWQLLNLY
jgi:hypothetical protein